MSYYTEFHFKANLRKDTPADVISLLDIVINNKDEQEPEIDNEFFELDRWIQCLCGKNCEDWQDSFSKKGDYFVLVINSNINYGNEEVYAFIDWISPYVAGRKIKQFVGWSEGEDYNDARVNHYVERPLSKHNTKKANDPPLMYFKINSLSDITRHRNDFKAYHDVTPHWIIERKATFVSMQKLGLTTTYDRGCFFHKKQLDIYTTYDIDKNSKDFININWINNGN